MAAVSPTGADAVQGSDAHLGSSRGDLRQPSDARCQNTTGRDAGVTSGDFLQGP